MLTIYANAADTLIAFIFSVASRLNYLVALGLSAYTEILGGPLWGNFDARYEKNYISFIKKCFDEKCGFKYMADLNIRMPFIHKFEIT